MFLSESYRKRLLELSGIPVTLNEDRIQKLRLQKYPENIIDFAYRFARETTRDASQEDNILRNQYIPWIAEQAKNNPHLFKDPKDQDKLNTIIVWIKNAGYPPVKTTENFNSVYSKAKSYLENKNIKPETGERVEGGKVIINYPDGSKWIRVTDKNWCMKVGEQRGWCFSEEGRTETFIGLDDSSASNQGYILLDKDNNPQAAIEYSPFDEQINDAQGAFNKSFGKDNLGKVLDLFSHFGTIKEIRRDTFWNDIDTFPELKEKFLNLKNIKLDFKMRLEKGLPLTKEEISNLDIKTRLKYGYPLTKSQQTSLKNNLISKVQKLISGEKIENLFSSEDFIGYIDYQYDAENKIIKLGITDEEWDKYFSGLDEYQSAYESMANGYGDWREEVSDDELDYMHYYLNDENKTLLKNVAKIYNIPDYDFEKDGNIKKFIEKYIPNHTHIFDDYLINYSYAITDGIIKEINKVLYEKQKFKYQNGYLILPINELYNFLKSHPEVVSFNDLKEIKINGYINLEDAYSNGYADVGDKQIKELNSDFEKQIEEFMDAVESGKIQIKEMKEINQIFKDLKFDDNLELKTKGREIKIKDIDYKNGKFLVHIEEKGPDNKPRKYNAKIPYAKLADFVHQYHLFENGINLKLLIQEEIKKNLSEDFRYIHDRNPFVPTEDVAKTAQNALSTIQNNNLINGKGSNEGSGITKAKSLSERKPMNHSQLKRMKAFFDNNEQDIKNEITKGKTIQNSGIIQSWNLWGGDAGRRWVEQQIKSTNSNNRTSKKTRRGDGIGLTKHLMSTNNTRIHR